MITTGMVQAFCEGGAAVNVIAASVGAQVAVLDAFLAAARGALGRPPEVHAHGPMPAPMPRRQGRMRGQLLLRSTQRPLLQVALREWVARLHALPEARKVRWSVDVDPVDLY